MRRCEQFIYKEKKYWSIVFPENKEYICHICGKTYNRKSAYICEENKTQDFICDKCFHKLQRKAFDYNQDPYHDQHRVIYANNRGVSIRNERPTEIYSRIPVLSDNIENKGICPICHEQLDIEEMRFEYQERDEESDLKEGNIDAYYCKKCGIRFASQSILDEIKKKYSNSEYKAFSINEKNERLCNIKNIWVAINGNEYKAPKKDKIPEKLHDTHAITVKRTLLNAPEDPNKQKRKAQKDTTALKVGTKIFCGGEDHICEGGFHWPMKSTKEHIYDDGYKKIDINIKQCSRCGKIFLAYETFKKLKDFCSQYLFIQEDEDEIYSRNHFSSMIEAQKEIESELEKGYYEFKCNSFIVRTNVFQCTNQNHKLRDIKGRVKILNAFNEVKIVEFNAAYCPKCQKFFILDSDYQEISNLGELLCNVFVKTKTGYRIERVFDLQEESLLHRMGYNVNARDGLNANYRHLILANAVDEGLLSRSEICSFLNYLINRSYGRWGFEMAIKKWEDDKDYISNYKSDEISDVIDADEIIRIEYKKR